MSTAAVVPTPAPVSQFFNFIPGMIKPAKSGSAPAGSSFAKEDFPADVKEILQKPLPAEALSQAPRGLTGIKSIFVTERLNEAFGIGRWYTVSALVERSGKDVVAHSVLHLVDYPWFYGEAFGGNNNLDLGDAYKGACTDALTKIAAQQLEVGKDVYKGQGVAAAQEEEKKTKAAEAEEKKKKATAAKAEPAASTTPAATAATAEIDPAAKKAATAAETQAARDTVANPPDCVDCKKTISTWTHPTNHKVYDAADLIKNSQKKYGPDVNLCADCQAARATALKAQSKVSDRTQ